VASARSARGAAGLPRSERARGDPAPAEVHGVAAVADARPPRAVLCGCDAAKRRGTLRVGRERGGGQGARVRAAGRALGKVRGGCAAAGELIEGDAADVARPRPLAPWIASQRRQSVKQLGSKTRTPGQRDCLATPDLLRRGI
jgi:hypothetical protein